MARTATSFVIGFTLGAVSVIMYEKLKTSRDSSDPDSLVSQLSEQLDQLERMTESDA